ncbi:MAG: PIN domain-containing protein [Candidatus Binataceae bacterium]
MKYTALDTNCFLHYQSLENIDWLTLLKASEVRLIIFPIVIRELDQKKYDASPLIRRRAQAAIAKLRAFRNLAGSTIREGVSLAFESKEPSIDFEANQLDRTHPDDRFVASALQMKLEKGDLDLTIITNDFGLELKASGRFRVMGLPEKYLLPEEKDPKDDELKKLRTEIDRLNKRFPEFAIEFEKVGGHRLEVKLPAVDLPADADLKRQLDQTRREHPKRTASRVPWGLPEYTEAIISGFNEKLDRFYEQTEKYLADARQYDLIEASKIRVQLVLRNTGKGPATDIDVEIPCAGEKLLVVTEAKYPPRPEPPSPPDDGYPRGLYFVPPNVVPLSEQLAKLKEPDVSSEVKPCAGGYSMNVRIRKLKHGKEQQLPPFFILLAERNLPAVGLNCRITCNELSSPVEADLGIVVTR